MSIRSPRFSPRPLTLLLLALVSPGLAAETAAPSLRAVVERARYRIESEQGAYRASNPAHGLRVCFSTSGVGVTSGKRSERPWRLRMGLTGWGYGKEIREAPRATLVVSSERIEYRRGPLTEWYVNDRRGLEQGFTLARRPASRRGHGGLVLRLALSGSLRPSLGEGKLLLSRSDGERVLQVAGVKAWDASGRDLPSRMVLRGRRLALLVDDAAAVYPITVDPSITSVKLTASDAAPGDFFGNSVALNGNIALIGAPHDDDGGADSGSAYVFQRKGAGWTEQARLMAGDPAPSDEFGVAVALSGNTALIGSPRDDDGGTDSGSAYVFVRSGAGWSQQAKLTASDAAAGDRLGSNVAISGDTAVIAAPFQGVGGTNLGAAYVFVRSGVVWSQQQKLTATVPAVDDFFGVSVSVSGDTAVIGALFDDDAALNAGAAYVFVRDAGVWSLQQKLTASDAVADDLFGASAAVTGDTAVIGAPGDLVAGVVPGSAYVFIRSGAVWNQQQKLTASDGAPGDSFGGSVAVAVDSAVVGAPFDDDAGANSGSAYFFERSGGVWSQVEKLTAGDATAGDRYGTSVAVHGGTVLVGAFGHSDAGPDSGAAYISKHPH